MPELPEVETIVRDIRPRLVGRRIVGVETDWPKYLRSPRSLRAFRGEVAGWRIRAVDRILEKYGESDWTFVPGYPHLDRIVLYEQRIDMLTGKRSEGLSH